MSFHKEYLREYYLYISRITHFLRYFERIIKKNLYQLDLYFEELVKLALCWNY